MNSLFDLIIGILFPATPTALSVISDFGLFVGLVVLTIGLVKRFTNW